MKKDDNKTNTISPTNPPLPNDVISAVKLATTSIPKTDPPVKMYQRIVTGRTAIKIVPNPPKNPATYLITLSMLKSPIFLSYLLCGTIAVNYEGSHYGIIRIGKPTLG